MIYFIYNLFRCQSPVLTGNNDDSLSMCDQCRYTFCKKCHEIFHFQTMCPKDYLIEQLKIQKQKELERLKKQRDEALAQLNKAKEQAKSLSEQKIATQKYRQIVIKLSEKDALVEELLNAEKIESLDTQHCPRCRVRIEKNGGCSHMHCSRCNHDFTWQPLEKADTAIIPTSVNEELNKAADIGLE
jgi:hypothetical protein